MTLISIIKKIFIIFTHINLTSKLPNKKKLLLFDDNLSFFLEKYFKDKYEVLYTRKKKVVQIPE